MNTLRTLLRTTTLCGALAFGLAQNSRANLITNGDFEASSDFQFDQVGMLTGWNSTGYNFVFLAGTGDTVTGSNSQYGNLQLWGPNNGSVNGLDAAVPGGGNFVAADGAFDVAPITQMVTGLVPGKSYSISFSWGAAQQESFDGKTTNRWMVSLGGESFTTPTYNLPNHGFSGWMPQTFVYTATSSSELLSFLAQGTPDGEPPFAVLSNVDMELELVPECSNWIVFASLSIACVGVGALRRRRPLLPEPEEAPV